MQRVLYKDQIQEYAQHLKADLVEYLGRGLTESFEGFSDYNLMTLQWYDVSTDEIGISDIMIYIDREDLFFFCSDKRSFEKCSELMSSAKTNERALYLFFVALLSTDAKRLDQYEVAITNAEDAALQNSHQDYLDSIRDFRKELLRLKRYYEELNTMTDHLTANDNQLFTKDGVRHFAIVNGRVAHFYSSVLSLRDYVTQMREACQSQIDIEQNKLMKVFTVVAAIFLPLTLITGWYGMNFHYMPELSWRYGYLGVVLLSAAVCVGLVAWFKHNKWL